jgi:hypothetical protein
LVLTGWHQVERHYVDVTRISALRTFDVFEEASVQPLKAGSQADSVEFLPVRKQTSKDLDTAPRGGEVRYERTQ